LEGAGYGLVDRGQLNLDPVAAMSSAVRESIRNLQMHQSVVVGALPGQSVVIRYPRLPEVPESKLAETIEKEAGQHIPYDLAEVFLDWTLLENVNQGDEKLLKILLVAVKNEVIDSRMQVGDSAEVPFHVLGVDSLALADAAEACDFLRAGETVALVNVGLSSVSIHFVKDGVSNFIRDISWGTKELIQALVRARRLEYDQAEKLLCEAGLQEEKAEAAAAEETAPQPEPAPASSSGASLLEPFEDEEPAPARSGGTRVPDSEKPVMEILATPLNRLVSEIRRSFEYYEHELYESPIDRLILSGGIANIPNLRQILHEELGIKEIETADPLASALVVSNGRVAQEMRDRPAQFMVAVGLAARGTAEL
jgi:type IV pilus assembly protein PilM